MVIPPNRILRCSDTDGQGKSRFFLTPIHYQVTYATMAQGWRPFFRKQARSDRIEARIASGGEEYGHLDLLKIAEAGQWICRNPQNGHTWVMSEEGMEQLYAPVNSDDPEWQIIADKFKKEKTKRKNAGDLKTKKISSSYNPSETGPLFFDELDGEKR